jgi:CheY-like chemotaxis protein
MPELDGLGAIRAIRANGNTVPIVSLTAHALANDRERCLSAGACGYETKPITRQRLADVVARHAIRADRAR